MTLQQLEYVVSLDTYRHFVTAAEKCFVTQPTITIQVKKLEEEIGFLIFDKRKSPFSPTDLGEMFIKKAKIILREVGDLQNMMSTELNNINGEYTIGVIPTISPYLIPLISGSFSSKYPNAILKIHEMQSKQIIDGLQKKEIDLGILVTPLNEPFIREVKLYNEPFVFYGQKGKMFENKKRITAKEVEKIDDLWILENGHCFREQVLNICDNVNNNNKSIKFQSGSIEALKKMVDHYGGITLVPEMAVNMKDIGCNIHFEDPKPAREVSIVMHHSFSKEILITALRKEILDNIPKHFVQNKNYMKINWR